MASPLPSAGLLLLLLCCCAATTCHAAYETVAQYMASLGLLHAGQVGLQASVVTQVPLPILNPGHQGPPPPDPMHEWQVMTILDAATMLATCWSQAGTLMHKLSKPSHARA